MQTPDVHYLDDRRVGGFNPEKQVLQVPIICQLDLIEVPLDTLPNPHYTIDPEQVTCDGCKGLL